MGKFPASSHPPHVRPGMTDLSAHTPMMQQDCCNRAINTKKIHKNHKLMLNTPNYDAVRNGLKAACLGRDFTPNLPHNLPLFSSLPSVAFQK